MLSGWNSHHPRSPVLLNWVGLRSSFLIEYTSSTCVGHEWIEQREEATFQHKF